MVRDSIKIRKTNNSKVYTGWSQKWTSAKAVQRDRYIDIQEVVRGPFSSPRLLQAQPFITVSSCQRSAANVTENCNIRRGIPDAWREYLAIKGLCNTREANLLQKNLIPSCVRCFATDKLWNDLGLPLIQGIPDPWKNNCINQDPPAKCLRRRHSRGKNICVRVANVYDGDDEAEIGCNFRYQCSKDHVDNKKAQEVQGKSNFSLTEREALRIYTENWDEVKKRTRSIKEPNIDPDNHRGTSNKECNKNKKCARNKCIPQKVDGWTNKEYQCDKVKVRKKIQTDMITKVDEAVQTCAIDKEKTKCINTDLPQNLDKCNQKVPNAVCCNCLLRNHMVQNVQYCPNLPNELQGINLTNRVLCEECENLYCSSKPKKVSSKPKKKKCKSSSKRRSKSKEMSKCSKYKFCGCMRKTKPRISTKNKSTNCHIETKDNVCNTQELKLMCCRCNSPYLKIGSIQINGAVDESSLCACKKLSKLESKETKIEDHVVKYSAARSRRNIARCSEKISCTCAENKRYIPRRDLERSSHSMAVKCGNGVAEKCCATFEENNLDVTCNRKAQKADRRKITDMQHWTQMGFCDGVQGEKIIKLKGKVDSNGRQYIDCKTRGISCKKNDVEDECCGNIERSVRNVKFDISEISSPELDKSPLNSVSDSGQCADISDNVLNVGFNVTAHDELSVTSVTLIRRLDDAISTKKTDNARKLKKHNIPCRLMKKCERQCSGIDGNMVNKSMNTSSNEINDNAYYTD